MSTLEKISEAIKLIDTKKEALKKAFDDLQSHSSLLSSFSLCWSDLDSHFTSVQASLSGRLNALETLYSQQQLRHSDSGASTQPPPESPQSQPESSEPPQSSHPELTAFCEGMDGLGLRNYLSGLRLKEREAIREELAGALMHARDPGRLVLDAMEGFYGGDGDTGSSKDPGKRNIRRNCVLLLETLMRVDSKLSDEVRESAKKLALEWREKGRVDGSSNSLEVLGLLSLVGCFRLVSEFSLDEVIDYCARAAQFPQFSELCRAIGLGDRVKDVIEKLRSMGKHLVAVKITFDFGLAEIFPPVSLLKDYVKVTTELANKTIADGKNSKKLLNEATNREINVLKSVIKVIEDRKLDSEYPKTDLEKRIQHLEKQMQNRKRDAAAPAVKMQPPAPAPALVPSAPAVKMQPPALALVPGPAPLPQQQQKKKKKKPKNQPRNNQFSGRKRPLSDVTVGPSAGSMNNAGSSLALHAYQQPRLEAVGLLADCSASYLSPAACTLARSSYLAANYTAPSAGLYGMAGTSTGLSIDPAQLYSSESLVPSLHYDRSTAYSEYASYPQYHPSYYPQ